MKILIVCSSNVCRSPFAEFYFRRIVENDPVLKEKVTWLGSGAVLNHSKELHPKAKQALISEGFSEEELSKHTPRHYKENMEIFENADVIIGMSKMHKFFLPKQFKDKFFTLSEIAIGKYVKIPDPFLIKSQAKYNNAMTPIKTFLNIYADNLKK